MISLDREPEQISSFFEAPECTIGAEPVTMVGC